MDFFQLLASVIASIAWPVAIVTGIFLLRRELMQVLRRLRRLKYGEAEAEFGEKLEEVEEDIAELPAPVSLPKGSEKNERFQDAGRFSYNSAVFVSWLEVESAVLNLGRSFGILETNMPASRAAQILLSRELIDRDTFRAIRELQQLRNIAVHPSEGREVSKEQADRFKKLADKVAAVLEDRRLQLDNKRSLD